MSKMKIVDLSQYRKEKEKTGKDSGQSNREDRSFEEKLQNIIHKPFGGTDSKKELIAIFEEEQLKKDENE
ncbi:MAG: hypothetical protein KKF12_05885 [Proteobacteria bacterium]|nr:hypothetical protein [Desulfobacula sp.]MBU3952176.1 hypothetical protein [Pseudomonadota bacterium]MBU4130330.1 hypothetical protein [Pseudomonadota bacterium]